MGKRERGETNSRFLMCIEEEKKRGGKRKLINDISV